MRLIACFILLLTGSAVFAGKQSRRSKDPVLTTQTSQAGRFEAAFPATISKPDTRRVKSEAGELVVSTIAAAVSRELTLAVSWTDYPESFATLPAETMLDAVVSGMKTKEAKQVGKEKLIPEQETTPAGREVVYDYGKYRVRARLFWVGTRLYQVTATGDDDEVGSELANKFLASFRVTK
jgi:hypothetical protein